MSRPPARWRRATARWPARADGGGEGATDTVGEDRLERTLAGLRAGAPADPAAGLFGQGSAIWRVDREAGIFLGAGAALLLQLAHPFVTAGVAQHSRALDDPVGRFHRTFDVMFTLVFGTADQAVARARELHRRHAGITGPLDPAAPGADRYAANDPAALRWVLATLAMTALTVHERTAGPLEPAAREAYWRDNRRLGACFGLAAADLPEDWAGFEAYWRGMLAAGELAAGPAARVLAGRILSGAGRPWLRAPGWYLALTAGLLPPALRDGFGLPAGPEAEACAARAWDRARRLLGRLPPALRHVGPYQEAVARLSGQRPGLLVRGLNRAWIGRPSLR